MTLRETDLPDHVQRPNPVTPRTNGLNLLRLLLASCVLLAHALLVAGAPPVPHTDLGYWGVAGFFCISGYLVTRSATRLPLPVYLRHRLGRLMPAYWLCLIGTGVIIAPLAVLDLGLVGDGLMYTLRNVALVNVQTGIAGTPESGHYPGVWNASLWTLPHEFLCYVVVGALVFIGAFRHQRAWFFWCGTWVVATLAHVVILRHFPEAPFFARGFIRLLPLFLAGAMVQARWPINQLNSRAGAFALAGGSAVVVALPAYGLQLGAPLLAYGLMAVGLRVPSPKWIARHDLSYGTYLYAFPVTQLLAAWWLPGGGAETSVWLATITIVTVALSAASWFGVERRALRWARREG